MPVLPPTRPLLAASAALLAAVSAWAVPSLPDGPASQSVAAGRAEAAATARAAHAAEQQAAEDRAAALERSEKDRATRSRARTAAEAREARAKAAARARAARIAKAKADARAKAVARAKAAKAAKAAKERAASRSRPRTSGQAGAAPARTSWPALNRAIAAIPGYRDGIARWHVTSKGHYGLTDANQPGAANIYISPSVPSNLLYSVVAHEYGHAVVIANYGTGYGPYTQYSSDMVSWFGGDKVTGLERAADCMARKLGATWTHYTSCGDSHWQKGANILLAGGRL